MATTRTQEKPGFFSSLAHAGKKAAPTTAAANTSLTHIAAQFDVRNISSTELSLMSSQLYDADLINREEFAMLSFQPEMKSTYDHVGAQGVQKPDPTQHRDALAEWEAILKNQEAFGNSDYFAEKTRGVVALLRRLDKVRKG